MVINEDILRPHFIAVAVMKCDVSVQVFFFYFGTLCETVSSIIILYAIYYDIFCDMVRVCACGSSSRIVKVFC
jgi:hypothetical protein